MCAQNWARLRSAMTTKWACLAGSRNILKKKGNIFQPLGDVRRVLIFTPEVTHPISVWCPKIAVPLPDFTSIIATAFWFRNEMVFQEMKNTIYAWFSRSLWPHHTIHLLARQKDVQYYCTPPFGHQHKYFLSNRCTPIPVVPPHAYTHFIRVLVYTYRAGVHHSGHLFSMLTPENKWNAYVHEEV